MRSTEMTHFGRIQALPVFAKTLGREDVPGVAGACRRYGFDAV
jgi:hypothetical protein